MAPVGCSNNKETQESARAHARTHTRAMKRHNVCVMEQFCMHTVITDIFLGTCAENPTTPG